MSSKTTRRVALVVLGLMFVAVLTLLLPVPQWRSGRLGVPPLSLLPGSQFAEPAQHIWIDTDAACGTDRHTDPDDCFAILLLTNASDVRVVGISTVFGNAPRDVADRTVEALRRQVSSSNPTLNVYSGSAEPLPPNAATDLPAHQALRDALAQRDLTIVALGPLTNVAAVLRAHPDLQRRVIRIIAVMGRRPGHMFHPTEGAEGAMLFGHGPVFSDLNFVSDPLAATEIVRIGVPLVLVPYDAARHVELMSKDLEQMRLRGGAAAWVAERAFGWLDYWRDDIGRAGFYPFDLMAAIFTLRPELLLCARVPIRIGNDVKFREPFRQSPAFLAGPEVIAGAPPDATQATGSAVYCPNVADGLHEWLSAKLSGARS